MKKLILILKSLFIAIAITIAIPLLTENYEGTKPRDIVTLNEARTIAMEYANKHFPPSERESFQIFQTEFKRGHSWFVSLGSYGYNYPSILTIEIDAYTGKIIKINEHDV